MERTIAAHLRKTPKVFAQKNRANRSQALHDLQVALVIHQALAHHTKCILLGKSILQKILTREIIL